MSNKLQNPTDDEKQQRPAPVEKKERQRQNDHRYADTVRKLVKRVLVLGFVVGYEVLHCSGAHHFNKYVHRAAANHSFFARLVGRKREMVQSGFTGSHG